MDYCPENALKMLCCTCLSRERKLFQLCRLVDGVNNLYSLLSYDAEAYKEGFFKDTASLHVCWECKATLSRISLFRYQVCSVQKQLTDIADGRTDIVSLKTSLSTLKTTVKKGYDVTISDLSDATTDNFIDCGPASVKTDDDDDIPLSELHHNCVSDDEHVLNNISEKLPSTAKVKIKKKKAIKTTENEAYSFKYRRHFSITQISYEDMLKSREAMKSEAFKEAPYKCESCIQVFRTDIALERHTEDFHTMKENHSQCSVCLSFTPEDRLESHINSHFTQYSCKKCEHVARSVQDATDHMKRHHKKAKNLITSKVRIPAPKRNAVTEKDTQGFICPECNKYFETKSKRWKHVQRHHREGYACDSCGKRFAFRNNLTRHMRVHQSPPPRSPCAVCHKQVRRDLLPAHARTHDARETCQCRACDKTFVSRASYEHHLKYTRAHAQGDILKHKCSECDKGFRSRGELRDHIDYRHENRTRHKCPECGKDKKGLREHEFIHTGERPLSCEVCGRTFRQSASLYTHRKRVHKIYPQKKSVQLLDSACK